MGVLFARDAFALLTRVEQGVEVEKIGWERGLRTKSFVAYSIPSYHRFGKCTYIHSLHRTLVQGPLYADEDTDLISLSPHSFMQISRHKF
jgi:hypothetical protein